MVDSKINSDRGFPSYSSSKETISLRNTAAVALSSLEGVPIGQPVTVRYNTGTEKKLFFLGTDEKAKIVLLENERGKSCNAHITTLRSISYDSAERPSETIVQRITDSVNSRLKR